MRMVTEVTILNDWLSDSPRFTVIEPISGRFEEAVWIKAIIRKIGSLNILKIGFLQFNCSVYISQSWLNS